MWNKETTILPRSTSKQDSKFTWLVTISPKYHPKMLVVKQRNLLPSNMQGQSINTPLDLSTHLTDPFNIANETKTVEVKFCAYPKSSPINENKRNSRLPDRENEESQNCDKAISSYNQMYADALLSR